MIVGRSVRSTARPDTGTDKSGSRGSLLAMTIDPVSHPATVGIYVTVSLADPCGGIGGIVGTMENRTLLGVIEEILRLSLKPLLTIARSIVSDVPVTGVPNPSARGWMPMDTAGRQRTSVQEMRTSSIEPVEKAGYRSFSHLPMVRARVLLIGNVMGSLTGCVAGDPSTYRNSLPTDRSR